MISSGGHFFKCTDEDADRRIVAVTSWVEPSGKQWKDGPAQDPGTEEEALPSRIKLSVHYTAIQCFFINVQYLSIRIQYFSTTP